MDTNFTMYVYYIYILVMQHNNTQVLVYSMGLRDY